MSIIHRALSTISFKTYSQTTGSNWTKLGRNVPFKVLFKNCSQNLIPSKTLVAMATKWDFFKQFFKNLLLQNRWSDFEVISQKCSFVNIVNGGLLALYEQEEILKKSSPFKLLQVLK